MQSVMAGRVKSPLTIQNVNRQQPMTQRH